MALDENRLSNTGLSTLGGGSELSIPNSKLQWWLILLGPLLALAACHCVDGTRDMKLSHARVGEYSWGEVFSVHRAQEITVVQSAHGTLILARANIPLDIPSAPGSSTYLEYVDSHLEGVFIVFDYGQMDGIADYLLSNHRGRLLCGGRGSRRQVTRDKRGRVVGIVQEDRVTSRYCAGRIGGIWIFRPIRVSLFEPLSESNVTKELPDSVSLLRQSGILSEAHGLLALYR